MIDDIVFSGANETILESNSIVGGVISGYSFDGVNFDYIASAVTINQQHEVTTIIIS